MKAFTSPSNSDGNRSPARSTPRRTTRFGRLANTTRLVIGSPWFTSLLLLAVAIWLASGPFVGFSQAWQLTATAGAPIGALLMVVVLQHAQNRDDMAIHLKLDEIIRSSSANDGLISIEDSNSEDLSRLRSEYRHHDGHRAPGSRDSVRDRPRRSDRERFAKGDLGPEQSFVFRSPEGGLNVGAHNLVVFTIVAAGVDDETWLDHLHRGDFSRWFGEVIGDHILTSVASNLESEGKSAEDSRRLIIKTIADRYPLSA